MNTIFFNHNECIQSRVKVIGDIITHAIIIMLPRIKSKEIKTVKSFDSYHRLFMFCIAQIYKRNYQRLVKM